MQHPNRRFFRFMAVIVVLSLAVISCRSIPVSSRVMNFFSPSNSVQSNEQIDVESTKVVHEHVSELVSGYDITYLEDFSDSPDDWDFHDRQTLVSKEQLKLNDGTLDWDISGEYESLMWYMPYVDLRTPKGDFYLETTLEIESNQNPFGAGFIFRFNDYKHFYFVAMDKTGQVLAGRYFGSKWENLADTVRAKSFNPGVSNTLGIYGSDSTYTIYVNGNLVSSFHDELITGGNWGMAAFLDKGDQLLVTFDEIKLMQPKDVDGSDMKDLQSAVTPDPDRMITTTTKCRNTKTILTLPFEKQDHFVVESQKWPILDNILDCQLFSVLYPFTFKPVPSVDYPTICLDTPAKLCLSIQIRPGKWTDSQELGETVFKKCCHSANLFQMISSQPLETDAGQTGYLVNYYSNISGQQNESMRLFLAVDGVGYDVIASGEPNVMQAYRDVITKMLASFIVK
jgi:hypothetical protein